MENKNRPSAPTPERKYTSEDVRYFRQGYCIIFGDRWQETICYFYTQNLKEMMLMATAKKLPSGSWRVRVFSHYEYSKDKEGNTKKKAIYESFTSDDPSRTGKREAEAMAAEFALKK